ncbi:MAG TPA: universal stress protein [Steroidobacteraceae bacterium]|nr:universal stress protein [Steroidobacteraceae bacterium]
MLRTVLLATDLSARCDRALERAVALVGERRARLVILHVFAEFEESNFTYGRHVPPEWRAPADAVQIATEHVRQGLYADATEIVEQATVLVAAGEPADAIERVAVVQNVDLVVTGIAREGPFASTPVVVGRTVARLLRRLAIPILIVRSRPRGPYDHVAVMSDFSEASAHALRAALRLFPDQTVPVLHAFEAPHSGTLDDLPRRVDDLKQTHEAELAGFVTATIPSADDAGRLTRSAEYGQPRQLVREWVRDRRADLVVLGTGSHGAMREAPIGSTAKSILQSLPCDALLVRAPAMV